MKRLYFIILLSVLLNANNGYCAGETYEDVTGTCFYESVNYEYGAVAISKGASSIQYVSCRAYVIPHGGKEKYKGSIVIPEYISVSFIGFPVLAIKPGAFENSEIETVEIVRPQIKTLPRKAFFNCSLLKTCTIGNPKIPLSVEDSAFMNCEKLETVQLNAITTIGKSAFRNCKNLRSLMINNSVERFDSNIFDGCPNLKELKIQAREIPDAAENSFSQDVLENVSLIVPKEQIDGYRNHLIWGKFKNISVGDFAVELNYAYQASGYATVIAPKDGKPYNGNVKIPDEVVRNGYTYKVNRIGNRAFEYANLKSVSFGANVRTIGESAFYGSTIESMVFPESIESTGTDVFYNAVLKKFEFENNKSNMKTLRRSFFYTAIFEEGKLYIPEGVTTLEEYSLPKNIAFIYLPSTIEQFSGLCFYYNHILEELKCAATIPPKIVDYNYDGNNYSYPGFNSKICTTAKLYVPKGSRQTYKNTFCWKNFNYVYEQDFSGVETIQDDDDDGIAVVATGDGIEVSGADEEAVAEVYTVSGQLVYRGTERQIPVSKGIYIVRIAGNALKVAVK